MEAMRAHSAFLQRRINAQWRAYENLEQRLAGQGQRVGIMWDRAVRREERRSRPYAERDREVRPQMARRTGGRPVGRRHVVATMTAQGRADRVRESSTDSELSDDVSDN